jgi:hypothetical protein
MKLMKLNILNLALLVSLLACVQPAISFGQEKKSQVNAPAEKATPIIISDAEEAPKPVEFKKVDVQATVLQSQEGQSAGNTSSAKTNNPEDQEQKKAQENKIAGETGMDNTPESIGRRTPDDGVSVKREDIKQKQKAAVPGNKNGTQASAKTTKLKNGKPCTNATKSCCASAGNDEMSGIQEAEKMILKNEPLKDDKQ